MANWARMVVKVIATCGASFIGMVAGGFILNGVVGVIYLASWGPHPARNSEECARDMALGYLIFLIGALTGAIILGYATYKTFDDNKEDGTRKLN